MPITIGTGEGEYPTTINHISNGEPGSEDTYNRPAKELENRTKAIRTFVEAQETILNTANTNISSNQSAITTLQTATGTGPTGLTTKHNEHVSNNAVHREVATVAEAQAGGVSNKAITPLTAAKSYDVRRKLMYDSIVGDITIPGVTHSSLTAALADPLITAGSKILVTKVDPISSTIEITKDNLEIEFRRGVTIARGSADITLVALEVKSNDLYLSKARFQGFGTAVKVHNTSNRTTLRDIRYVGNTTTVANFGVKTSEVGAIVE